MKKILSQPAVSHTIWGKLRVSCSAQLSYQGRNIFSYEQTIH